MVLTGTFAYAVAFALEGLFRIQYDLSPVSYGGITVELVVIVIERVGVDNLFGPKKKNFYADPKQKRLGNKRCGRRYYSRTYRTTGTYHGSIRMCMTTDTDENDQKCLILPLPIYYTWP